MLKLTSRHNKKVKYLKSLQQKKFRDEYGKFLIEGVRSVEEALNARCSIDVLIFASEVLGNLRAARLVDEAAAKGITQWLVTRDVLAYITETKTPQGVAAVVHKPEYSLSDIKCSPSRNLILVIDRVQDPGNLGTIIRAADAFSAAGIILIKGTTDMYAPKVVRATVGSIFHLPIVNNVLAADLLQFSREHRYPVVVLDPRGEIPVSALNFNRPVVAVMGSEAQGCSTVLREVADHRAFIPISGKAESLNVAVAASIVLYESIRTSKAPCV
ncbi:MAG: RNA methyltransferase [Peptococcaceae bacterium]|nr:RNA methyltransferase [Peptococcaceae bacterium]